MKVLFAGRDADLVLTDSAGPRPEGLHVSDITKQMIFERDRKYNPNAPLDMAAIDRGFTWERVLELSLSSRQKRPGYRPDPFLETVPGFVPGIWHSPDWINPDGDIQAEEWKATKKSTKHEFTDKNWIWMPATKAYLRGLLKRRLVQRMAVRFRVWHVNGDYSFESKTDDFKILRDYWRYDIEFDKRELEENWRAIVANGKRYGLLREENACPATESQTENQLQASLKDRASKGFNPPPTSSRGKIVTFPSTRKSKTPRAES